MVKIKNIQKNKLIKNLTTGSQAQKNRIFTKFLHRCKETQKTRNTGLATEKFNSHKFKSIHAYESDSAQKMQQIKQFLEVNRKNLRCSYKDLRIYYGKNTNLKIKPLSKTKRHIYPSSLSYSNCCLRKRIRKLKKYSRKNVLFSCHNRKIMLFILGECNLAFNALSAQIGKFQTRSACPLKVTKKTNLIFQQLLALIEYMAKTDMHKEKTLKTEETIRSKVLIENACLCLDAIAELNQNRFIFRNLDTSLKCNKILLSRLVLNTCYHILTHCKRQSTIEVLSYCEDKKFIIEFLARCDVIKTTPFNNGAWRMLLREINGSFICETKSNNETAFKLIVPYENIHF